MSNPVAAHPTGSVVTPSESDRAVLMRLRGAMVEAKVALADRTLEALNADRAQLAAEDAVKEAMKALETRLSEVALSLGIDPKNPAHGRWSFDLSALTFTRVGGPPVQMKVEPPPADAPLPQAMTPTP